MSSNPRTEVRAASHRLARWRSPAGWSLRTRLVAIMIALLAVLGLVVGGTTEAFLHRTLYDQVDSQLHDAQLRAQGYFGKDYGTRGNPNHTPSTSGDEQSDGPPGGAQANTVMVEITSAGVVVDGSGILKETGPFNRTNASLPAEATAALRLLPDNDKPTDVNLGSALGDYRVIVTVDAQRGTVTYTGLPLDSTQATLLKVTGVIGGAVLLALLIAGWAGAVIIRRTLLPLSRVAATATRVSELELDRGEVDLAQRVPDGDTDLRTEVGQVGAALNRMLEHVASALEARQASETQLRQFLADASHELRTPLAAIRGYAELTRRSSEPVPDEIAHVLRRVESEAQRMTTLVEDLLLLARLDAGRPLAHDPVDLTALVVDAVSDAHAAGPRHYWQLDLPDEPVIVIGDQQRLHQVLANLLANARTHTPEGTTVTVAVNASPDVAMIRVIDGGPGIPAELQPHIFKRFARGDSSRSRAAGSTGLGLSIVNAVVTAHGGGVSVQSQPGYTQFTVLLPLALPMGGRPPIGPQEYARITR
jgi:two-component system OmpR family sensor kinase